MLSGLLHRVLDLPPAAIYAAVTGLVFLEDAVFVGFVVPGETAAVLGGVAASQGSVLLPVVMGLVVLGAIVGDTVGYEVGKHLGTRVLDSRLLARRRAALDRARDFLARRGGSAVFLGRFTAFFRAVMPALAGSARMPYRRFAAYNMAGGLVWGVAFVLVGYLAGNSYEAVQRTVGTTAAVVVAVVVVVALVVWRVRAHRRDREAPEEGPPATG